MAAGSSSAMLLGGSLGFPQIAFDNQGLLTYDAATDELLVESDPLGIRLVPGAPILITPTGTPPEEYVRIAIQVDASGNLIGGGSDPDLVVFGEVTLDGSTFSGELLTGEVTAFGYQDSGGTTDLYDFRFDVTGGLLQDEFAGNNLYVFVTSEQSTFVGNFGVNFDGEAKGDLGTEVPEPAACLLLAGGLVTFALRGRPRR